MINDVSFIVIARNEEFAVHKCLSSIFTMPLKNCEVICVDSASTDDTLEVMKKYAKDNPCMSIFRCRGNVNAAVARNVGLVRAKKKYICFCDGDTAWESNFISQALTLMEAGEAGAVTGCLKEIVYSNSHKIILQTSERISYPKRMAIYHCGGNFMVRKEIADKAGLWEERMVRNEDIDYTLRVSRYGRFIGLPVLMGTHHTKKYDERVWDILWKGLSRAQGALIRKNLDRPKAIAALLMKHRAYTAGYLFYILCIVAIILIFCNVWSPIYIAALPLSFLLMDLLRGVFKRESLLERFVAHYCYIPAIMMGLLFGPGTKKGESYVEIIH